MGRLIDIARRIVEGAAIGVFLLLLGLVLLQVVLRFVFGLSIFWSEEFVRFALVWVVMLSAGLATCYRQHIRVDLIDGVLSERARRLKDAAVDILSLIFLGFLLYYGIEFAQRGAIAVSPAMGVPRSWVYVAIPIGAALMILFLVLNRIAAALGPARQADAGDGP